MNELVGVTPIATTDPKAMSARHAMLRQMGVDVWLLRRQSDAALPSLSAPAGQAAGDERELPTAQAESVRAALEAPMPSGGRASQPAEAGRASAQSTGRPVAPFSVVCLSKGPVLMLVELGPAKAERRFALDVLAASSGIYGGETAQLAFEWPQPGVDNNPQTLKKALGAFVSKQLSDQAPSRVLIGEEVSARLEQIPDGSIELAPLAELMVDGERKKALWMKLAGR